MRNIVFVFICIMVPLIGFGQDSLDELLDKYNTKSIPYISVEELIEIKDKVILLDAREKPEYLVSHLKDAIYVGYDHFNIKIVSKQNVSKDTPIVVYCSLGIRSEDISEKLKKSGYKNVRNLYGGIFEWKNKDQPVVDDNEKLTDKIHAYSIEWGKWLQKGTKKYKQ